MPSGKSFLGTFLPSGFLYFHIFLYILAFFKVTVEMSFIVVFPFSRA